MGCCQNKDSNELSGLNFSLSKRKEKIKQAANKGNHKENLNFEGDNKNDTSRIGNVTFQEEMLTTPRSQIENTVYLKVLESATIREGTIIPCNANEKKVFYFGKKNNLYRNDFDFPDEIALLPRHFKLKYDEKNKFFLLKAIEPAEVYLRVKEKTILRDNTIILFGSTHLSITLPVSKDQNFSKIIIKNTIKKGFQDIYEFNTIENPIVKVGRSINMKNVDICIDDESISRVHCMFSFIENNWYIIDGDGVKPSTNGLWILLNEYTNISEGDIFRAGENFLLITMSNNSYSPV